MSVTCCPLSGGYWDSEWSFFKSYVRRSRKSRHCDECGKSIEPGDRYENASGLFDGYFSRMITCVPCVEVRDHFACNGYMFGQIWSDIEENFFPNMVAGGECLQGATPTAKAKLFEQYNEWLFDGGHESRQWFIDQEYKADCIKEKMREGATPWV